jgi:predicted nucleotidyltransferase
MDEQLKTLIDAAKRDYDSEGFILLGVFGSRARGDFGAESDLDILYRLEDRFLERHPGWTSYKRIDEIKNDLARRLGMPVDFADIEALDEIGRKYILSETIYVS